MTDLASAEAELSNYRGALSLYKHALSIDPHHIGAMVGVGLVSKKLGDNKTSTAFFKEAIAQPITSNERQTRENNGVCLLGKLLSGYRYC